MRILRRIAGALLFALGIFLIVQAHLYFARRLVLEPDMPEPLRTIALVGIAVLGVSVFFHAFAERMLPRAVFRVTAWPAYLWLGTAFYTLLLLWLSDGVLWALGARDPVTRAWVVGGLVLACVATGVIGARRGPRTVRLELTPSRWTRSLDRLRIVQISDLHVGAILGRSFASRVVDQVNALQPDLIAITGDLVDGRVETIAPEVQPFANLKAPLGVYFVTGNHDHYSGDEAWVGVVRSLGIRVLRNERVTLEHGTGHFDLAGVDDHRGGYTGSSEDLPKALDGRDPTLPLVLLAHDPATFVQASRAGVDLQLSGHTHGGQIWPFRWLVRLSTPFVEGLHRRAESQIYVSRGTGFWGPPMRLFAPAEITVLELSAGG